MTPFDKEIAARTLWMEARGEGSDGLRAVAHVIQNRGRTAAYVCLKSLIFSCWNAKDGDGPNRNREHMAALPDDDSMLVMCRSIVDNPGDDLTDGATNYHAVGLHPDWAASMQYCTTIGHHAFYKERHVSA